MQNIIGTDVVVTTKVGNSDVVIACSRSVNLTISAQMLAIAGADDYEASIQGQKSIKGNIDGFYNIGTDGLSSQDIIELLDAGREIQIKYLYQSVPFIINAILTEASTPIQYNDAVLFSFSFVGNGSPLFDGLTITGVSSWTVAPEYFYDIQIDFNSRATGKYKLVNAGSYTTFKTASLSLTGTIAALTDVTHEIVIDKPHLMNSLQLSELGVQTLTFSKRLPLHCNELILSVNELTTLDTGKLHPYLTYVSFFNNKLSTTFVNNLLRLLDSGVGANIYVNLSGGTNAAPTGAGITAKNNIIARGGTVLTN